MSLPVGRNNVYYVGVARLADRVVVAQHSYNVKTDPDSVKTVLRQQMNMRPGTVYNFDVSGTTWHLTGDDAGRVFILITRSQYPLRFAHQCLEEFQRTFVAKVGDKSLKANENGLTRTMSTHLTKLCAKYDNLEELDQLTALNAKVESVKITMQENVRQALEGTHKIEALEKSAEELQAQAGVFKKQAHDLRKHMWWKNCKMKLIIAAIVLAILAAVIIPVVVSNQSSSSSN